MRAPVPSAADPLSDAEFAALMAGFGPFEPAPHLTLAVSGGADSVALMALASAWLAHAGGRGTVLTVDHRLRPASGLEARWVAAAATTLGLGHRTLVWQHTAPRASEAAARTARYRLLDDAARELGCLHLLVAHHADDQAVTRTMRLARGDGPGGAGMSAIRELEHCRLLRPLLGVPGARLHATARAFGRGWLEDPSNRDPRLERNRTVVAALPGDAADLRQQDEARRPEAVVDLVRRGPRDMLILDRQRLERLPDALAVDVLRLALGHVGDPAYLPSPRATAALRGALRRGRERATLGGALVTCHRATLRVEREAFAPRSGRPRWPLGPAPFAAALVVSRSGLPT
ncbi:MAG: tRNA lysidine(34) synthetase TilS [Pseudomonadota bacterium]